MHGVSVADSPLSRTIGVALSDNSVQVYFRKGAVLPSRKTISHKTTHTVAANSRYDALTIPIVQGEYQNAHRNCLIGTLEINGVKRNLPVGSEVTVSLELDRSGQLHAHADIAAIGQRFSDVAHVLVPTASLETLEDEYASTLERYEDLLQQGFSHSDKQLLKELAQLPVLMQEAETSIRNARGNDPDAKQRLHRLLLESNAKLDRVEETLEWPNLVDEAEDEILNANSHIAAWGNESEQQLFDRALDKARVAIEKVDALELERQIKGIEKVGWALLMSNAPRSW